MSSREMPHLVPDGAIARSAAGLFRCHIEMLETMAGHCDWMLRMSREDENELREAAKYYRELVVRLREVVARAEVSPE